MAPAGEGVGDVLGLSHSLYLLLDECGGYKAKIQSPQGKLPSGQNSHVLSEVSRETEPIGERDR